MRVLLIGNYGAGNLGDELLREALQRELEGMDVDVVSASPREGELPRLPTGMRSLLATPWWRMFPAMQNVDAVVFGGGTLFTDSESVRAPILWGIHAALARKFKKPIHLSYQGIGPLRTPLGRIVTSRVLRNASSLSLRDTQSKEYLSGMNIPVVQAFDPVFGLLTSENCQSNAGAAVRGPDGPSGPEWEPPRLRDPERLVPFDSLRSLRVPFSFRRGPRGAALQSKGEENTCIKNVFMVIPRFSGTWSGNQILNFRTAVQHLKEQGRFNNVEILSFAPGDQREWHLCETLSRGIGRAIPVSTKGELLERLHRSAFVLSQRYHGLIAALAWGIPCAALAATPNDKLMTLAEDLRFPGVLLSEWNGMLETLLHDRPLSPEQKRELLDRCERGRIALHNALTRLEKDPSTQLPTPRKLPVPNSQ